VAVLTPQLVTRAGTVITYQAASGAGDATPCFSGLFLHYRNGGGASITVTINVPPANNYLQAVAIASPVVTIPAGSERMIGPIDRRTFADPLIVSNINYPGPTLTGTLASISYSGVTSVTVAAIRLQQPDDGT
jgi:hypothetical protein